MMPLMTRATPIEVVTQGVSPTASETDQTSFYLRVSLELIRAIRGKRSQVALSRRLGYSGNPITDWERGVRHPTAKEILRVAGLCRLPVSEAFLKLTPLEPPAPVGAPLKRKGKSDARAPAREWAVHPWLAQLRGSVSNTELARRLGVSRYCVSRWCSGETEIRLDELLHCIDVLTGRLYDFVSGLVTISAVPSLLPNYERAQAARVAAVEHPWTEAILRVLETEHYRAHPAAAHATLAATLGISDETLERAMDGLVRASVVSVHHEPGTGSPYYRALRELSVDTRADPQAIRALQRHWLEVGLDRARQGRPDWVAYNVFSCSAADLGRVRDCFKRAFRESRSVIANSQPNERAGLVLLQFVEW